MTTNPDPKPPTLEEIAAIKKARTAELDRIRRRLIVAISDLGLKVNTSLRAIIDSYIRHVSPTLADRGASMLPRGVRVHLNPKLSVESDPGSLLCFHVGHAILGYYAAVQSMSMPDIQESLRRTCKVEELAAFGPEAFVVSGSIMAGFSLELKPTA